MASKSKKSSGIVRKISKPVISTDVMGNRNVEVRAVGAWVQAAPLTREPEAVLAAEEEEYRLRQLQIEKQMRLKQFQSEVRKRVNRLDRMKKQEKLETNYQAAEHERHVVGQSAFCSSDSGKKDTSLVRPNTTLAVQKVSSLNKVAKDGVSSDGGVQAFSDQTNQVHDHVKHAKKNLVSRQVITDKFRADDLPGGVWKVSGTRDVDKDTCHPSSRCTVDGNEFDNFDENLIEKVKIVNNTAYNDDGTDVADIAVTEDDKENSLMYSVDNHRDKTVRFIEAQTDSEMSGGKMLRPKSAGSMPVLRVPNIYEGIESEEEKRRARSQLATYRRLFMDIEREQVKENLRRQEHRKRIVKLKKEKEEERVKVEQITRELTEPRDPVTGETSQQVHEREEQEKRFIRQTMKEHESRVRKTKEMERYIEALRQQLKEKVRRKKIELPPLCCCGDSIWDTHPETCANNCFFYKNPKEYGRALQSMLDSSEFSI